MDKKYVSFRIEKESLTGAQNEINHDFRIYTPKYVRRSDKDNFALSVDDVFLDNCSALEYSEIQKDRVKRLTGRKAQKTAMFFMSAIMTFSETMAEDYKNNPDLYEKCSLDFNNKLQDIFGLQILYSMTHLDEKTPHNHMLLDNISKKDGKGIDRRTKPKDLEAIQTLMGECFAPMGYVRGIPVAETHSKHLPVQTLHKLEEIKEALGDDINVINNLIDLHQKEHPALMMLLNILSSNRKINFKSDKVNQAIEILKEETQEEAKTQYQNPRIK